MHEFEAYAPPVAETETKEPEPVNEEGLPKPLAEAIRRLNEHLASEENVRADEQASGGLLRKGTRQFIFVGLGMVLLVPILIAGLSDRPADGYRMGLIICGVLVGAVLLAAVLSDFLSPPPGRSNSPVGAMENYFRAIRNGRHGRAWSMLCPTARKQSVRTPNLGKLPTFAQTWTLETPQDFETHLQAFLSPTIGNSFHDKAITLVREHKNVAAVDVFGVFYNYRLWPVIFAFSTAYISWKIVPFVCIIILFAARRTHEVMFRKTLIRGSNGFWYIYSGQFMERPGEVPEVTSPGADNEKQ